MSKKDVGCYVGLFVILLLLITTEGFDKSIMLKFRVYPNGLSFTSITSYVFVGTVIVMVILLVLLHTKMFLCIVRNQSNKVQCKVLQLIISVLLAVIYYIFFFSANVTYMYSNRTMYHYIRVLSRMSLIMESTYVVLPIIYSIIILLDKGRKTKLRYVLIPIYIIEMFGILFEISQGVLFAIKRFNQNSYYVCDAFYYSNEVLIWNVVLTVMIIAIAIYITSRKSNSIRVKWFLLTGILFATLFVCCFGQRTQGGIGGINEYKKVSVISVMKSRGKSSLDVYKRYMLLKIWHDVFSTSYRREYK